jgi:hypothetical protein
MWRSVVRNRKARRDVIQIPARIIKPGHIVAAKLNDGNLVIQQGSGFFRETAVTDPERSNLWLLSDSFCKSPPKKLFPEARLAILFRKRNKVGSVKFFLRSVYKISVWLQRKIGFL